MSKQIDQKKTAAASYLLNFYREVQEVKSYYAQYENVILELESKYSNLEDMGKMNEIEQQTLKQIVQLLRNSIILSHVSYKTLVISLPKVKENEDIETQFLQIKKKFIIDRETAYQYVENLNKFLVQDIIKDLVETSETIVNDLFKDE